MKQRKAFWRYLIPAEVLTSIGLTRIATNILEKARKSAVESSDGGRLAAVYAAQASLERRKGDAVSAIALLKKAVEVAPADEVGIRHVDLAMAYKEKGDYDAATSHFSHALGSLSSEVGHKFKEDVEAQLQQCRQKLRQR